MPVLRRYVMGDNTVRPRLYAYVLLPCVAVVTDHRCIHMYPRFAKKRTAEVSLQSVVIGDGAEGV
jgi:hypothetical protein